MPESVMLRSSLSPCRSAKQYVAARAPALYATGAMAAYWSIGRIVTIIG
jgi:hypothetical protein